jgi:formylglycine-generating enzyme
MRFNMKFSLLLVTFIILIVCNHVFAGDPKDIIRIKGGTFFMGSDAGKIVMPHGGMSNESPVHEVKLDGFWIDKYPVTNENYAKFVKATGYVTYSELTPKAEDWPGALPEMLVPASIVFKQPTTKVNMNNLYNWWEYKPGANWKHPEGPQSNIEKRMNHPVVHVTYADAAAYCSWAGKHMLTEAQWEYAARGGLKKKVYTWGDQPDHLKKKLMNFWEGEFPYKNTGSDGHLKTSPVGSYLPNGYGLYDMAGNVWEWVSDWYHPRYYEVSPKENPTGVPKEHSLDPHEPGISKRIIKGGSFLCSENYCMGYRPSARMATDPRSSTNHTGFRCAKKL